MSVISHLESTVDFAQGVAATQHSEGQGRWLPGSLSPPLNSDWRMGQGGQSGSYQPSQALPSAPTF